MTLEVIYERLLLSEPENRDQKYENMNYDYTSLRSIQAQIH